MKNSNPEQDQNGPKSSELKLIKDLEKKNRQMARQLEVESALEKVRFRAMDMRNSSELAETSAVLFHQLKELGIKTIRTGVAIFDEPNDAVELWLTIESGNKEVVQILDYVNIHIHPVFENLIPARKKNRPYVLTTLSGDELKKYYQTMSTYLTLPVQEKYNPKEFFYSFFFPQGSINIVTKEVLGEDDCDIMIRMASVFGLIYTRFLDLQKAENYTKEVVRQASFDRIRAEIASMRTSSDLEKITPLMWNELSVLEVPFFRCGVFIMDEKKQVCQVYLTTPTGNSLAAMELPFGSSELVETNVLHWREKKVYFHEWNKEDFADWTNTLVKQGFLKDAKNYQDNQDAPDYLALHFVPFTQGMLYVGSGAALFEDHIELIQSLANAFSVAYARYEDFNHLEETLRELKSAQAQLIHSEKMASLGELTAGIAHEIQNPLNFVNNFSDLNEELIGEIKEGLDRGDIGEAKAILENLSENEKKINHHGKRADAIVKSMLQHSRSSNGQKELTDINVLCEEYLRLAYHGMRAKDKSFNALFETDLDPDLPKINVIPQDIGRVLLNLINNAFHACLERSRETLERHKETFDFTSGSAITDYSPKVTVQTIYVASPLEGEIRGVTIRIKDNGPGIPASIADKVFQPFFTTKPTGKGTGLGLSLAYEIVTKGHGGELKLETKEGKGTSFIIVLPISK